MAIKLASGSAFDAQINETNTAARQYYLPDNNSGLGTRLMSVVNSTSGTAVDFTGIPSWAKRITVILEGVSTNGSSNPQLQVGSGSIVTAGYSSYAGWLSPTTNGTSSPASGTATTGFLLDVVASAAAITMHGTITLYNITGSRWVASGIIGLTSNSGVISTAGGISLSGALDRVRLTTVNGTDTFDAGSVNVMYE